MTSPCCRAKYSRRTSPTSQLGAGRGKHLHEPSGVGPRAGRRPEGGFLPNQTGHQKEPGTPPGRGPQYKRQQRHADNTGADREYLVGNRREPGQQDVHGAPAIERLDGGEKRLAVGRFHQPGLDQAERQATDQVTGETAGDRADRAQRGEPPGALRARQAHRRQHDIGWDRKETGFRETQAGQDRRRPPVPRPGQHTVVQAPEDTAVPVRGWSSVCLHPPAVRTIRPAAARK